MKHFYKAIDNVRIFIQAVISIREARVSDIAVIQRWPQGALIELVRR